MLAGIAVGAGILKDRNVLRDCWMIPLRDLFGFAVWLAGLFGNQVQWRDRRLRLAPDGRIRTDSVEKYQSDLHGHD
jgi:ceramide glucosyltransferase